MNKTLLLTLSLSFPAFVTPVQQDALTAIVARTQSRTPVNMRVSSFGSFLDVTEPSLRVSLRGSRSFNDISFSGRADDKDLAFTATPNLWYDPLRGYSLRGSGVDLSMQPSSSGFWVTGFVGQRAFILDLRRFGGSFTLSGRPGADLNVSGSGGEQTVSGIVDSYELDTASLAVLGAVIGVAATLPAQ